MPYRIKDVLESAQVDAPAPRTSTADIIAAAHRIRARRRWAAVAGAGGSAVLTVAAVAGITGGLPRAAPPEVPPAAVSPAVVPRTVEQPNGLAFTIGEARTGKWQVGPAGTATFGYQQIPVYRDGKSMRVDDVAYPYPDGTVVFYQPGVYDITTFGVGTRPTETFGPPKNVTIAGRPGIERELTYVLPDLQDMRAKLQANPDLKPSDPSIRTETFTRTAFAWKFDGTAWATFVPDTGREPLSRSDSLAIVEALRPRAAEPARVPYTFGWLPAGWSVTAAEKNSLDIASRVFLDRRVPTGKELAQHLDDYPAGGQLTIWRGKPKTANAPRNGETLKCLDHGGYCTLTIDRQHFAQFERIGTKLSMDDVRRILRGLTLTDVADESTWKPVPGSR